MSCQRVSHKQLPYDTSLHIILLNAPLRYPFTQLPIRSTTHCHHPTAFHLTVSVLDP
jgi:hypothetical protein